METETTETAPSRVAAIGSATRKTAYALVGAPLVAGRRLGRKSGAWRRSARREFEAWVTEGERMTAELRQGKVVEEIKEKVDFDHLQDRVEKLRDQLEDVLANWRATFKPEKPATAEAATEPETAAKKTVRKTTATAKADAADKAGV